MNHISPNAVPLFENVGRAIACLQQANPVTGSDTREIQQLSLERLTSKPGLAKQLANAQVMIRSGQYCLFWRPQSAGYTKFADEAGLYDFETALKILKGVGPEKGLSIVAMVDVTSLSG